jgi:hypothetical protein
VHRQFRIAAAALGLCCVIAHAQDPVEESEVTTQGPTGDVIVITGQGPALDPVPSKGMDKSQVTRAFGQPAQRHAPVGGGSRQQPPITRWDYDGYTVFFEYDHVVDAVRQDRPAPIKVREGLQVGEPVTP